MISSGCGLFGVFFSKKIWVRRRRVAERIGDLENWIWEEGSKQLRVAYQRKKQDRGRTCYSLYLCDYKEGSNLSSMVMVVESRSDGLKLQQKVREGAIARPRGAGSSGNTHCCIQNKADAHLSGAVWATQGRERSWTTSDSPFLEVCMFKFHFNGSIWSPASLLDCRCTPSGHMITGVTQKLCDRQFASLGLPPTPSWRVSYLIKELCISECPFQSCHG